MSITQGMTTSFKVELFNGVHDFSVDTLKFALYTAAADLDASTTVYTTSGEVSNSGTGYTTGGVVLTNVSVAYSGTTAYVSFDNPTWNPANFTARGALIYNASKSNKSIAVLDFGSDKTTTTTFIVQVPPANLTNAILRIQ